MAREATAGELTSLRSSGQWSRLYLAIHKPAVVFAARVNQSFDSTDEIAQVTFDTVTTGAYTDILAGMTVYVGSTAGAYDLGMCRVRGASATVLSIGRTSEIAWTDNLYITVVDEFGLWARHWFTPNETTVFMDTDIAYSDQNANFDPCPVLGPDAVLWLTGATVNLSPTAAASWVLGSTITGYSWTATGASATANLTTATPTITYNAAGNYRISCTVTAANGKSATGYRRVFVYSAASMPAIPSKVENCKGDVDEGGWSFTVEMVDQAAIADVRERAKVVLFAQDYYGNAAASIGPVTGYENIVATGWIDEESIEFDPEQGAVRFTVRGPAYWLGKLAAFPGGLKNSTATPTDWKYTQTLTVDKALHNLIHWRSTIDAVMDCYLSGDTRNSSGITTAPGSLWSQLREIGARILAEPRCDRYGRLFVEIDTQYTALASRSSIPVVMEITKPDWTERIRIPRKTAGEIAMLETGGTGASATTVDDLYFSRSYGKIPALYGAIESKDNLLVASQADLNTVTGYIFARRNNAYPLVSIPLAANNRMVDIAPRQYVTLSIAAGDTERGITWTATKLIPRRVTFGHDADNGTILTDLECEAETSGAAGLTVIPPQPPQTNIPTITPPTLDFPTFPPGNTWFPPTIPGGGGGGLDDSAACSTDPDAEGNGPYRLQFTPSRIEAGASGYAYFPCTLRPSDFANKSYMRVDLQFIGDAEGNVAFTAINAAQADIMTLTATRIATGYATFRINLYPLAATGIAGFKVAVAAGGGNAPTGSPVASGAVDPRANLTYTVSGLDPAKVYCVTSSGYWNGYDDNPGYDATYLGDVNGGALSTGAAAPAETPTRQRYYLYPTGAGVITIHFTDSPSDNVNHGFVYLVYETTNGRAVIIDNALLYNVCAAA